MAPELQESAGRDEPGASADLHASLPVSSSPTYTYDAELPPESAILVEILKNTEVQHLFEVFNQIIGIPIAIIDRNANVLFSSRWQRICTDFHRVHPEACKRCIESDTVLALNLEEGRHYTKYFCKNGLMDCASPIIIEGNHLSNMFIGQFLPGPPDEDAFRRQAELFGFDTGAYLDALRQVPIVEESKLPAILDFLVRIARLIAAFGLDRKCARDAEKRLSAVLNSVPHSIFWKDRNGVYLGCNENFARETGLGAPEAVTGKTDFDLPWPSEHAEAYRADDRAVIEGNRPKRHFVEPMRQADGTLLWVDTSKIPLTDEIGRISGVLGVFEDITERRRAEEELAGYRNRLEELVEARTAELSALNESLTKEIAERQRMEEVLRQSEETYRLLFESVPIGIVVTDAAGQIYSFNARMLGLLGYSAQDLLGTNTRDLYSDAACREELLAELSHSGKVEDRETGLVRQDRSVFQARVNMDVIRLRGQELILVTIRDITDIRLAEEERRKIQAQFQQAQKLEAVGRLAGGIAHDFNNLLTVILGLGNQAMLDLPPNHPLRPDIKDIVAAGERAAGLTKQLLAFSRKQVSEPVVLSVNDQLGTLTKMLGRMIGEDVNLVMKLEAAPDCVKVDPGQLEQVIMNLAVNARDAMPNGGTLVVETSNTIREQEGMSPPLAVPASRHVMIAVSDTGTGIDKDTMQHMFEPFFTTKGRDKGTGLGLATVFGIVKQAGGDIRVYSEPGLGTTFRIYLPESGLTAARQEAPSPPAMAGPASETILVVEDEEAVRRIMVGLLRKNGYRVFDAEDDRTALDLFTRDPHGIDMVITDVIMPGVSGRVLSQQLEAVRPGLKVLFVSGYTDEMIAKLGVLEPGINFLAKPFLPQVFLKKVRSVLDKD